MFALIEKGQVTSYVLSLFLLFFKMTLDGTTVYPPSQLSSFPFFPLSRINISTTYLDVIFLSRPPRSAAHVPERCGERLVNRAVCARACWLSRTKIIGDRQCKQPPDQSRRNNVNVRGSQLPGFLLATLPPVPLHSCCWKRRGVAGMRRLRLNRCRRERRFSTAD